MKNGWEPGGPLNEVWSHLHCVVVQSLPSDDRIIMDHVWAAHALMEAARQKAIKGESMYRGEDRFHIDDTSEDPRGDPPEPIADDWPDREDGLERARLCRVMSTDSPPKRINVSDPLRPEVTALRQNPPLIVTESDYFDVALKAIRAQVAALMGPQGDQVRESIEVEERAANGR